MKIAVLIPAVALIIGCSRPAPAPRTQERRLSATEEFNLRGKCADLVEQKSAYFGAVGNALVSDVRSHYNPTTNRCYAEITITKNFGYKMDNVPKDYRTHSVVDAQTGDQLVFCDAHSNIGDSYGVIKTPNYRQVSYAEAEVEIDRLMETGKNP